MAKAGSTCLCPNRSRSKRARVHRVFLTGLPSVPNRGGPVSFVGIARVLLGGEGDHFLGKMSPQDRLLDAGSSAVRGRKAQHQLHFGRFQELDGNTWFGRRQLEQISLFQQFHRADRFFHEGCEFFLGSVQQCLFRVLSIVVGLDGNGQCV